MHIIISLYGINTNYAFHKQEIIGILYRLLHSEHKYHNQLKVLELAFQLSTGIYWPR